MLIFMADALAYGKVNVAGNNCFGKKWMPVTYKWCLYSKAIFKDLRQNDVIVDAFPY